MEVCNDWLKNIQTHKETNTVGALMKAHFKSLTKYGGAAGRLFRASPGGARSFLRSHQMELLENEYIPTDLILRIIKDLNPTTDEIHNFDFALTKMKIRDMIYKKSFMDAVIRGDCVPTKRERDIIAENAEPEWLMENWERLDISPEKILMRNDGLTKETFDYFFYAIDDPVFYRAFLTLCPGACPSFMSMIDEPIIMKINEARPIMEIFKEFPTRITLVECNLPPKMIMDYLLGSWEKIVEGMTSNELDRLYGNIARIGYNINITREFIEEYWEYLHAHPKMEKFWLYLATNNKALGKVLRYYPSQFRSFLSGTLELNRSLTLEDVLYTESAFGYRWDWKLLSRNPSVVTPETIEATLYLPWVWGKGGISSNPSITHDFIVKHHSWLSFDSDGGVSSLYSVVTAELVKATKGTIPWDYGQGGLSSCEDLTIPWVCEDVREGWMWYRVFQHAGHCTDIAAKCIQSAWRLWRMRQACRERAEDVIEWWYSPDCRPGVLMRRGMCMGEWGNQSHQ